MCLLFMVDRGDDTAAEIEGDAPQGDHAIRPDSRETTIPNERSADGAADQNVAL